MFRLLVFDLDGTLVDSRKDLAQATNRLIAERGGRPLEEEAVVHMVGEGAGKLIAKAFAAADLPVTPDALPRFLELYGERLSVFTRPYPGVPEMLASLDGTVPMAVLTNKPRGLSEELLEGLGLRRHFANVVGGDGPYPRKPDPQSLLALGHEHGAAARETLLVGDSVFDLRTARAAGTSVALVRYGFGFADVPPGDLAEDVMVVDSPRELVAVLRAAHRDA